MATALVVLPMAACEVLKFYLGVGMSLDLSPQYTKSVLSVITVKQKTPHHLVKERVEYHPQDRSTFIDQTE